MEFKATMKKLSMLTAAIITGAVIFSNNAMADDKKVVNYLDSCEYLPLVNNPLNPQNQKVCVDAPVALKKSKVVFDITYNTSSETEAHTGLRHIVMLATALKRRIDMNEINPQNINIIGVLHGQGINLAIDNNSTNVTKGLINQIFAFKNQGVNVNLEICGVSLNGAIDKAKDQILSNFPGMDESTALSMAINKLKLFETENGKIHVNQGAIGRMIDLQQHGFTLIKE